MVHPCFFRKWRYMVAAILNLKKMHKGDFRGIFGIRLGRCPCIIPEKISFLQFYSRFNPNALALYGLIVNETLVVAIYRHRPAYSVGAAYIRVFILY